MARTSNKSRYHAPLVGSLPGLEAFDDTFERELLGFCVTAILDQRTGPNESRSRWADRLGLSKSHMSKMTDTPTPAFIELFDLALNEAAPESPVTAPQGSAGERLSPLLSVFLSELRPAYRSNDGSSSVIRWFARYRPTVSDHLADVLYASAVAEERCRLLKRGGYADQDPKVRASIRDLLVVVSGPFGASVISHRQCTELGLHVPLAFFDEVERALDSSPLGFRVLRTLVRFVRLWQTEGGVNPQYDQIVDTQLVQLLGKLPAASATGSFVDPYPGGEWAVGLARECLGFDEPNPYSPRRRLAEEAQEWLLATLADRHASDRGRLHAAWALVCHAREQWVHDEVDSVLSSSDSSSYLRRWAPLLVASAETAASMSPVDDHATALRDFADRALETFPDEVRAIKEAVAAHTGDPKYDGIREAMESVIVSALLSPDGQVRRAMIEAVAHAGLVKPTADVFATLLGHDETPAAGRATLVEPALIETAIFLHGRLRQFGDGQRIQWLIDLAVRGTETQVRHAAIWSIGDIWSPDLPALAVVTPLESLAADRSLPVAVRLSATHVLAIIAHAQAHREANTPLGKNENARLSLEHLEASSGRHTSQSDLLIRAICRWGTSFSAEGSLDGSKLLTLSGIIDGVVTPKN